MAAAMESIEGTASDRIATWPPLSSGPQISSVLASKASGAACNITVSADSVMKSAPRTSRTMARWGTITPLGWPVEPDVNMM
jgi:hypothetical protein